MLREAPLTHFGNAAGASPAVALCCRTRTETSRRHTYTVGIGDRRQKHMLSNVLVAICESCKGRIRQERWEDDRGTKRQPIGVDEQGRAEHVTDCRIQH